MSASKPSNYGTLGAVSPLSSDFHIPQPTTDCGQHSKNEKAHSKTSTSSTMYDEPTHSWLLHISKNNTNSNQNTTTGIATPSHLSTMCMALTLAIGVFVAIAMAAAVPTLFFGNEDSTRRHIPTDSLPMALLGNANPNLSTTTTTTTTTTTGISNSTSTLSTRGQSIHPVRGDFIPFLTASADPYDPILNPDGYLVMLVAENRLMYKELADKLQQVTSKPDNSIVPPEWTFDYGDMRGERDFRMAIADMMASSWMYPVPVDADSLIMSAGAGPALDSLAWMLDNAGDGVLVTGPAYAAFVADFGLRSGMVLHVMHTQATQNFEPTLQDLETLYDKAIVSGNPPRILIICQPNNPTGAVYSHDAMERMIDWALSKPGMHVVSDEIYGNSVFPGVHVTSAAHIMYERHHQHQHHQHENGSSNSNITHHYLGDYVHIVAGLSKDWGMSGFRVGTLMTHNTALVQAMSITTYYDAVSQYTQYALTLMLQDTEWRDWYLAENRRRLHNTYMAARNALMKVGITLFPGTQGGIFAWADASHLLHPNQTERELWLELYHEAKILFTSGESFYGGKPGMFRVVYPWPKGGTLAMEELGERLVAWEPTRSMKET